MSVRHTGRYICSPGVGVEAGGGVLASRIGTDAGTKKKKKKKRLERVLCFSSWAVRSAVIV